MKMLSDVSAEKSFRIKEDGGFFSRLVAKETSMANSSSRILYYGEASVGVPFRWESKPGTPKHPLCETSLPPLTPPPSYNSKSKPNPRNPNNKPHNIFSTILRAPLARHGKVHVSPSSSSSSNWSSSSSSSSFSLSYSSPSFSVKSPTSTLGFPFGHRSANGFRGCAPFGNIKSAILKIVGDGGAA